MAAESAYFTYEKSRIFCFPFVNAPPGDYYTIFTVITIAVENSKSLGKKHSIIKFDLVFYQEKNSEKVLIILQNTIETDLSNEPKNFEKCFLFTQYSNLSTETKFGVFCNIF